MRNNQKSVGDILRVAFSNIINLLAGVLVGFLIPKIMGVTDYGYYKIFTLYASYVGVFGLGIIDGIYLKYGGISYGNLNKDDFRAYSKLIISIQACVSVIIIACAIILLKSEYKFIFCAVAIYLLFNNTIGYFQIISQITSRFKELSMRNNIQSLLTICSVIALWILCKYTHITVNYQLYVIVYLFVFVILTGWYCKTYCEILIGNKESHVSKSTILYLMKLGIPLLFANLCSSIILSLDRQFVSILYSTNTYAVYSFAYNLLALVTTATAAISVVIYPILKQTDENVLINQYCNLNSIILSLVFCCLLIYYPLCWFVKLMLPQYSGSLQIFRIIFPGLALSSSITIVMHNYYKTLGINEIYFKKTIVILLVSFVTNFVAYKIWNTPDAISWASIFTLIIWYFISEYGIVKRYKINNFRNYVYAFIMIIMFYTSSYFAQDYLVGTILYMGIFIIVTMIFFGKQFFSFFIVNIKRNK